MANRSKSYLLVTIQFVAIFAILFTGPRLAHQPVALVGQALGILIGLWAVFAMGFPTLTILPDVKPAGRLTRRGPYRLIRHPMYLAVLLVTLALVVDDFSLIRLTIWLGLLLDIIVKINYEEQLLGLHYPTYAAYQRTSKRLIPFLY